MKCEPEPIIASSFAFNLSRAAFSFSLNLSSKLAKCEPDLFQFQAVTHKHVFHDREITG